MKRDFAQQSKDNGDQAIGAYFGGAVCCVMLRPLAGMCTPLHL